MITYVDKVNVVTYQHLIQIFRLQIILQEETNFVVKEILKVPLMRSLFHSADRYDQTFSEKYVLQMSIKLEFEFIDIYLN